MEITQTQYNIKKQRCKRLWRANLLEQGIHAVESDLEEMWKLQDTYTIVEEAKPEFDFEAKRQQVADEARAKHQSQSTDTRVFKKDRKTKRFKRV